MTETPASSSPTETSSGGTPNESGEPMTANEGGRPAQNLRKPTDIKGVKEGTPEYAAVDLILKVDQGIAEGLKALISEDATGILRDLRADDPTKALAEAKELFGQVQPLSSKLADRDTVVSFLNKNNKILQFYVRKIRGDAEGDFKYIVRELRTRDYEKPTTRRRE